MSSPPLSTNRGHEASISSTATGATAYFKMSYRPISLKPITTSSLPEQRASVVMYFGDAYHVGLVARILHERKHTPAVPFYWSWALRMSNVSVHCFEIVIHCLECRRFCARPLETFPRAQSTGPRPAHDSKTKFRRVWPCRRWPAGINAGIDIFRTKRLRWRLTNEAPAVSLVVQAKREIVDCRENGWRTSRGSRVPVDLHTEEVLANGSQLRALGPTQRAGFRSIGFGWRIECRLSIHASSPGLLTPYCVACALIAQAPH